MRTTTMTILVAALLAGCASIPLDDPGEFQALSAEAIPGAVPVDIRITDLHGFLINTYWTAATRTGRYGCMRDRNGDTTCKRTGS